MWCLSPPSCLFRNSHSVQTLKILQKNHSIPQNDGLDVSCQVLSIIINNILTLLVMPDICSHNLDSFSFNPVSSYLILINADLFPFQNTIQESTKHVSITFIMPFQLSPVETWKSVRKAIPKFSKVAWRLIPSHGFSSLQTGKKGFKHGNISSKRQFINFNPSLYANLDRRMAQSTNDYL